VTRLFFAATLRIFRVGLFLWLNQPGMLLRQPFVNLPDNISGDSLHILRFYRRDDTGHVVYRHAPSLAVAIKLIE